MALFHIDAGKTSFVVLLNDEGSNNKLGRVSSTIGDCVKDDEMSYDSSIVVNQCALLQVSF